MADFLRNLLGGKPPAQSSAAVVDDFADAIASPSPLSHAAAPAASASRAISSAAAPTGLFGANTKYTGLAGRPYTAWYRVWERTSIQDFQSELFILPFLILLIVVHVWGTSTNKRKARAWAEAHRSTLEQEFAYVGTEKVSGQSSDALSILRAKSANEYLSYASGRQNVAFVDIKLSLNKRYNPMARLGEEALGFFFENQPAPRERMEATSYCFDGKELDMVPSMAIRQKQAERAGETFKPEKFNSSYDSFVFAVVHKDSMKQLRDGRYDLSLTTTKDHAKLPQWASVMSESAEITESMLTSDLIAAVTAAGQDVFEALIVTDQPIDKPRKLNDALPRKRLSLSMKLPASNKFESGVPLFQLFLRLPDFLTAQNRFRPEALRRVKATREEEVKKIKKADEDERSEERRLKAEKEKKEERDKKLNSMSAEEQRKFLERERALEARRGQKRRTMKA